MSLEVTGTFTCLFCERVFSTDLANDTVDGVICDECFMEGDYTRCSGCDEVFPDSELYRDADGSPYCEACEEEIQEE